MSSPPATWRVSSMRDKHRLYRLLEHADIAHRNRRKQMSNLKTVRFRSLTIKPRHGKKAAMIILALLELPCLRKVRLSVHAAAHIVGDLWWEAGPSLHMSCAVSQSRQ
jgi:hypothetical protein